MKRIMRLLLVVGLLAGGVWLGSPSAQAGPFGRGPWRRGWGWGRAYGPAYGYRVYRPYGYGWGGYGMGYRGFGWGYPAYGMGYPGYGINNPALGVFGVGPGYGLGGYSGFYGTSMSIGSPMGGFYMSSYPY